VVADFIREWEMERGKESILAQYQKQLECDAAKFETVYREWKNAPDNKEKARRDFLFLGIAALPHAIEHLRNGETELMDAIDYWTDNKPNEAFAKLEGEKTSKKDFYLAWWEKNKDFWLLPQLKKPSESKE
ncbi:MAG TPA: hypothetical protein PK395_06505, partial [bacterium]|nr:hypothetical protein [bacterium]